MAKGKAQYLIVDVATGHYLAAGKQGYSWEVTRTEACLYSSLEAAEAAAKVGAAGRLWQPLELRTCAGREVSAQESKKPLVPLPRWMRRGARSAPAQGSLWSADAAQV
jgi:hypothetical protein